MFYFYGSTIDLSGPGIVRLAATVCRVAVWADEKGDVVVLAGILDGEGDLQLVGQMSLCYISSDSPN